MTTPHAASGEEREVRHELIRLIGTNDIDGIRRLVYMGALDHLRPESHQLVRSAATAGNLDAIRSHFVGPAVARLQQAVVGDIAAQLTLAQSHEIEWLELVVPARDYKQLQRRLLDSDVAWLRAHATSWALPVPPASSSAPASARGATAPPSVIVTPVPPLFPAAEAKPAPNLASRAELTRELFSGVDPGQLDYGEPPPLSAIVHIARARRWKWRRLVAPVLVLALAGWIVYLVRSDRDERTATEAPVRASATASTVPPTTAPPATTVPPTTAPPTMLPPVPPPDVLLFASGSSTVGRDADAALNAIAERAKADPTLTLSIIGYSDTVGAVAANRTTSLRRAQSVRDALAARGVTTIAEVQGAGPDASVPAAQARRVEVIYKRG